MLQMIKLTDFKQKKTKNNNLTLLLLPHYK